MNYSKHLFAFVDVLGFSSIVSNSEDDPDARRQIENFYSVCDIKADWQSKIPGYEKIKMMIMSDSIVAAMPVENKLTTELLKVFSVYVARFQNELAWHGIWVRGAITFGSIDFRPDQKFIVGPALVRAVEIEKNYAKYPRIVLDSEFINHLSFPSFSEMRKTVNASGSAQAVLFDWGHPFALDEIGAIKQDVPLFLDFFSLNDFGSTKADGIINQVAKNLNRNMGHFEKYRWLADYIVDSESRRNMGSSRDILNKLK
jgi:hypothetical protein